MSDKSLIYVAGNPDAYPLEYYDEATGTYQGVIPQLLAQFSQQSQYDVVYYSPQAKDQREHLAKNLQVDLLSGYTQGDDLPGGCTTVRLFHTVSGNGGDVSYYLCATEAAPAALLDELSAYFAALPQETVSGILGTYIFNPPNNDQPACGPFPSPLTEPNLSGILLRLLLFPPVPPHSPGSRCQDDNTE